uniref:glycosyltransferase n=1 Tax=Faecalibaculum rodentium TaxID=1702221 RepID=UPI00256EAAC0
MDKKVSVVMAACNGERYIGPQIVSILQQLGERDELIISLDPSTDQTESVISGFADSRIKLLHGPGQGIVNNIEHGLIAASGDYIFLADQDDIWHSKKKERILGVLKQDAALLVVHDCRIVDEALNELAPSYFMWHGTKTGFWNNLLRNSFIGCCM